MADKTVSQPLPIVKESNGIRFHSLGSAPAVLSTEIARHFQKRHSHILREIDRLRSILPKSFHQPNFGLMSTDVKIGNGATRQERAYLLTRDALSLLVMGMTGKAAIMWKLRYIEAFNALEAAALENRAELAREAAYRQGLDEGTSFPMLELGRKAAYLAGLKEADRIWRRNNSPRALARMMELREKGCTWREIGKTAGISGNAARKRVVRARERGGVIASPARRAA